MIMKMRMKIGYEACIKNKTIQELFLFSILKTYQERKKDDLIKNPYPNLSKQNIENITNFSLRQVVATKNKLI